MNELKNKTCIPSRHQATRLYSGRKADVPENERWPDLDVSQRGTPAYNDVKGARTPRDGSYRRTPRHLPCETRTRKNSNLLQSAREKANGG